MAICAVSELGSMSATSSISASIRNSVGGRCEQRASMNESGAFSMTGTVELGESKSRRVVKLSCEPEEAEADAPPVFRELRKFWTTAEASVEPDAALLNVSPDCTCTVKAEMVGCRGGPKNARQYMLINY
jgi:hypothetical protein